jgi:hypothetical protein
MIQNVTSLGLFSTFLDADAFLCACVCVCVCVCVLVVWVCCVCSFGFYNHLVGVGVCLDWAHFIILILLLEYVGDSSEQ